MKIGQLAVVWIVSLAGTMALFAVGCDETTERPETPKQRTVTVEKTKLVERTVRAAPDEKNEATSDPAASKPEPDADQKEASVRESAPQSVADLRCEAGQVCDLGRSTVTITRAQQVQTINTSLGDTFEGEFVIVEFDYTYGSNTPTELGEPPFQLLDESGSTYSPDFDATISYGIENDRDLIYTTVQPGVASPGTVIFEVSPDARGFTLLLVDPASPQSSQSAEVPLSTSGQISTASTSDTGGEEASSGSVDSLVSDYYAAVGREDWSTTYSMLDSASQAAFTEDEWIQKQVTRNAAASPPPLASVVVNSVTDQSPYQYANITLSYSDGSQETLDLVLALESGEYERHLTTDEITFLQNL